MYKTIVNPETGRKVNVNGKIGQKVLNNYKKQYGGDGEGAPCSHHSGCDEGLKCVPKRYSSPVCVPHTREEEAEVRRLKMSAAQVSLDDNMSEAELWGMLTPQQQEQEQKKYAAERAHSLALATQHHAGNKCSLEPVLPARRMDRNTCCWGLTQYRDSSGKLTRIGDGGAGAGVIKKLPEADARAAAAIVIPHRTPLGRFNICNTPAGLHKDLEILKKTQKSGIKPYFLGARIRNNLRKAIILSKGMEDGLDDDGLDAILGAAEADLKNKAADAVLNTKTRVELDDPARPTGGGKKKRKSPRRKSKKRSKRNNRKR